MKKIINTALVLCLFTNAIAQTSSAIIISNFSKTLIEDIEISNISLLKENKEMKFDHISRKEDFIFSSGSGALNFLNSDNFDSERSFKLSVAATYGTYAMNSMKDFQRGLYNDAIFAIDVPYKITDNFQGYAGYQLNLGFTVNKFEYGIQLSKRTTGGRIAYADYSGYHNIDNYLKNLELVSTFGYQVENSEYFEVIIGAAVGLAFTNHELSSVFQLNNELAQSESYDFSSINMIIGPSLKLRYYPINRLFIEALTQYDQHITGQLNYRNNQDAHLLNNNGEKVKANWSGLRGGLGIGIKL